MQAEGTAAQTTDVSEFRRRIEQEYATGIDEQRGRVATVAVLAGLAATSAVAMAAQALVDEVDPGWLRIGVALAAGLSIVLAYRAIDSGDIFTVDPRTHLEQALSLGWDTSAFEYSIFKARAKAYRLNVDSVSDADRRLVQCVVVAFLGMAGSVALLLL